MVEHDNIVIHYTAGSSAISTVNYLISEYTPVSAHLVIARDGKIYQLVDFNTQAWHAGKCQFLGKTDLNACSIGIKLDNAGLLHEHNERYYAWFGKRIPNDEVIRLVNPLTGFHAWWHTYTDNQLSILKEVCKVLAGTYRLKRILGHSEISLTGKIDPGPAFPLAEFKKLIY